MDRLERADHLLSDPAARARALGPAIAAAGDEIERTRRIPPALLSALHEARLFRLLLPRSAGGDEVTPGQYLAAMEEVARHDASVAWNLFVGNSSALVGAYIALDIAREIWRDPHTVVSWGPPNEARARAVSGGYRITGRWDFASGCRAANWMGAHGLVEEEGGKLRLNRYGRPGQRILLCPAEQATLLDTWNTIGLRGTASDSYTFDDVFIPEAYSSQREDPEGRRETGPLYSFTHAGLYAVGVAAVAFGIARAMLDALVDLATRKAPRNLGRMADSPTVQADVARAEARLGAARAYLLDIAGTLYERASPEAPMDIPDRARVRLGCTHAIHTAIETADFVYKACGVDGIFPGSPFERRFRDMHTLSQQIQSRGAHYEAVGHILLGGKPVVFL
ncbi:MAG: acyl-CoA dehydrogenase family protein [Reyranella sp.]|nr:acyl-CoA dehydrogenase family protein [Reyranella sp.]